MGNRAVITLDKTPTSNSVGIYLHWNGGAESILAFAEAAKKLKVRTPNGDAPYALARLVQIIGNFFGGTLSVGVGTLDNLDCDNGDNGLFIVDWAGEIVTLKNSPRGALDLTHFSDCDIAKLKKHDYWKPDDNGKNILDKVLDTNADTFKEE